MPRAVKPLSDTQVRQAKPTAKEYNLADGKGLYLRVKPIGSKLWLFNYTAPTPSNAPTSAWALNLN